MFTSAFPASEGHESGERVSWVLSVAWTVVRQTPENKEMIKDTARETAGCAQEPQRHY